MPLSYARETAIFQYEGEGLIGMERILQIAKFDPDEKACDHTRHLTGDQRVSLLEDLRREMTKVTHREYPQRLRRVLTIAKRGRC